MTYLQRFVGPGGSDANSGATYALRKLTLSAMEAALSAATRYTVRVSPGTYRETLTAAVSGPAPYVTGTVDVVAGGLVVTGHGTAWLANAEANDYFQVLQFAHGVDGVTNGTSTFTSAAGNFQQGHVGMTIRIDTKTAGIIATVVNATTVTLANTAGAALTPSAGSGLTYDVGPSGPIKVASVQSDTSLTLAAAWDFPTLTGLAYQAWGHVEYVGDYLGQLTDGVGGVVRITGSNDDQTATRGNPIAVTSINGRTFTGFQLDTGSGNCINIQTSCSRIVIEQCFIFASNAGATISIAGTGTAVTVNKCYLFGRPDHYAIHFTHSSVLSNSAGVVQNCVIFPGAAGVQTARVGGTLIRNCTFPPGRASGGFVQVITALTVGQAVTVNDCVAYISTVGFSATAVGEIQEDYNSLSAIPTNYQNTTAGAHSNTYPPLFDSRWFFQLLFAGPGPNAMLQVVSPFDLSAASQLINLAGRFPTLTALRGTAIQGAAREWGALEYDPTLKIRGGVKKSRLFTGGM